MQWSQLKKRVEQNLAESIKGKVEFFTTAYRKPNSSNGRGWITIEGKEIINFSTMDSRTIYGRYYNETTPDTKKRHATHIKIEPQERNEGQLTEEGEFSRFDLHICMFESLNMTPDKMLDHDSPILQTLGILDKRTGKRTLEKLKDRTLDNLPLFFLNYRLTNE
ncbi:SF0329 family protein [Confluentibacter lentus]|uniref:SF0329 family protein n=1 Tax=Confluentibacter lentus TaxID=1699412 RepID=UPI000C286385|nr:hypothetical protein [Confluentibacter lentus]